MRIKMRKFDIPKTAMKRLMHLNCKTKNKMGIAIVKQNK